jgi:acetoin utilization protein AcuB
MQVRDVMVKRVVTIGNKETAKRAWELMRDHHFRHLPVVDEQRRVVGIVSDRDLRPVLLSASLDELRVEEIMTEEPMTIDPEASVMEAARLMVDQKIGALPVVSGDELAGIVTETDLLSILVELLGLLTTSARIDVAAREDAGAFEEIGRIIRKAQGVVISAAALTKPGGEGTIYSFRLEPCDIHSIASALGAAGYEVISHEDSRA